MNDEESEPILKEADLDSDQHIDYKEFLQVRSDPRSLDTREFIHRHKMLKH